MEYMLLIYDDEARRVSASEDDKQAMYAAYGAYTRSIRESGNLLGGNALLPGSATTTVRVRSDETLVTDGPFAETKEQLGGYYLVDVGSIDEALEWAAKIPGAWHGSVEVRPVMVFDEDGPSS